MSLYLEGTSKAKLASWVSSRELWRSFMTRPERSESKTARGRGLVASESLHEETEVTEFSNCSDSWLVK